MNPNCRTHKDRFKTKEILVYSSLQNMMYFEHLENIVSYDSTLNSSNDILVEIEALWF